MAIPDYVLCDNCKNRLGERLHGDLIKQRHKGRSVIGFPVSITCEECGSVWQPEPGFVERLLRELRRPLPTGAVGTAA